MKVLLVGCGAVGLSLASALYMSGVDVDLIARGETAEAVGINGIERCGILGAAAINPEKVKIYDKAGKLGG
jgi:2-dehydropantoate 2-reductase